MFGLEQWKAIFWSYLGLGDTLGFELMGNNLVFLYA